MKKKEGKGKKEKGQKRITREFSVQSPNYCLLTVKKKKQQKKCWKEGLYN